MLQLQAILISEAQSVNFTDLNPNNFSFVFDVFRRKEESYRLPNAFVRLQNPKKLCVETKARFIDGEIIKLEIIGRSNCTNYQFLGRNHLPSTLLNYWTHYSPKLYNLEVQITDSTGLVFVKMIPVGIVDYRFGKEKLLVNNEPINLRSVTCNNTINDSTLLSFKKHHINMVILSYLPSNEQLWILDHIGLYLLIDLRGSSIGTDEQITMSKYQNHACIAGIIVDEAVKPKILNPTYSTLSVLTELPKKMVNVDDENLNLKAIRDFCQPFEIVREANCETQNPSHKFKISNTEPFDFWESTTAIFNFQQSVNQIDTTYIITSQSYPEISIPTGCDTEMELKYQISLITNDPFSVFKKNDTIAFFTNRLN